MKKNPLKLANAIADFAVKKATAPKAPKAPAADAENMEDGGDDEAAEGEAPFPKKKASGKQIAAMKFKGKK